MEVDDGGGGGGATFDAAVMTDASFDDTELGC